LNYEIKDTIFNSDFIKNNGGSLSPIDQPHYFENQELYVIDKHLPDIKYVGAPLKSVKTVSHVWVMQERNPYWIKIIKDLRSYLNYPLPNRRDWIKIYLEENRIPSDAASYLEMLYG
jgi:hypothetical protein